jgi:hypothetical protein
MIRGRSLAFRGGRRRADAGSRTATSASRWPTTTALTLSWTDGEGNAGRRRHHARRIRSRYCREGKIRVDARSRTWSRRVAVRSAVPSAGWAAPWRCGLAAAAAVAGTGPARDAFPGRHSPWCPGSWSWPARRRWRCRCTGRPRRWWCCFLGWPLAIPLLTVAGLSTMVTSDIPAWQALSVTVWSGVLPATLMLVSGATACAKHSRRTPSLTCW